MIGEEYLEENSLWVGQYMSHYVVLPQWQDRTLNDVAKLRLAMWDCLLPWFTFVIS